ncbi:hypothetical protein D7Y21_16485 [Corallococcus sp. AB045]|uniref:Imm5 family immunity protein n=1 Tax=Corallococcus sp. AB045 TaxID=2316719 RepID=UPI000ECE961B|nr:Imm5 family immunity protein [Corallococcus sp. AB045]RKH88048.1 hypothetical protein D7Y21_16485 [Corallococcus sp. AB045]
MGEPEILKSLLQRAIESVRADPVHDLSLGLRRKIWRSLGRELGHGPGYARRVSLALTTARHVLPLWKLRYSQDRTPHTVLDSAEAMRVGRLDKIEAQALWQRAWDHMVELSSSDEDSQGAAAGFSAVQALLTCIDDETFQLTEDDENLRDNQVDAEDMDASMFAAAASAGGPSWDASSDPERRLQFWEWWLSEAVPHAYRAVASRPIEFEVLMVNPRPGGVRAAGRLIEGIICVGDVFSVAFKRTHVRTPDGYAPPIRSGDRPVSICIEQIHAYGYSLQALDAGMTAELVLSGDGAESLAQGDVLGGNLCG